MEDKMIYEMYHNVETRAEAQEIAVAELEKHIRIAVREYNSALCYDDMQDIIQECRIAILQALDSYDYTASTWVTWYSKYLYNAMYRNVISVKYGVSKYLVDKYNIQQPSSIFANDNCDYDGYALPISYYDNSVEDIVIARMEKEEEAKRLHDAVNKLKKRQKETIIRYYGLDGSNPQTRADIAGSLGIRCHAVDNNRAMAIQKLRRIYGVADVQPQNYDKTGEHIRDVKGREIVIVRYDNCTDMDALMRDGDSYYLVTNATYYRFKNRDVMRCSRASNSAVKCTKIDANTQVYGKCACDYF